MHKKSYAAILVVFLLSLSLSGCFRSASTPPASVKAVSTTATKESAAAQATPLSGNIQEILSQTQTAAAASGAEVTTDATATKLPKSQATAKPTKEKTATEEPSATPDLTNFTPNLNPDRPETYTLKAGEYPICIARRYNLDVSSLLDANGLAMDSRPKAGVKLTIPQSGSWNLGNRALHEHPTQYTVKSGDTFYSIACYFGDLLPSDAAARNGKKAGDKLSAGTVLEIP
jgi:LysM repeat protein